MADDVVFTREALDEFLQRGRTAVAAQAATAAQAGEAGSEGEDK